MTKAEKLINSVNELNESYIGDIVDYGKTEKKEEGDNIVATLKVKGTMGTQDARRLMSHIGSMGYETKMTTDNLGVVITVPKASKDKAKKELGVDL